MLHTLWSVKGGSGVTIVTAALGAAFAERTGAAVIVDLCGDQPAALGLAEPTGPGVLDWLATPSGTTEALERLLLPVRRGLELLPRGALQDWPADRAEPLVAALDDLGREVVIDAGRRAEEGDAHDRLSSVLGAAGTSVMVVRPCYLALRRATRRTGLADGVVVVLDDGRALDARDVGIALDLPVLATVPHDPSVAGAVDAGVLARRTPRSLDRALRELAA